MLCHVTCNAVPRGSIAPVCHGTPRGFYQKIAYACDCSGIFSKWKRGVAPQITYISSFDHVSSANNSYQENMRHARVSRKPVRIVNIGY